MAGKARRASIFAPFWPQIDGLLSSNGWTADPGSLDCEASPAGMRPCIVDATPR